jgi:glutamine amidotransferase
MIGVIDYGLGNVQAFLDIYKRLNISAIAVKESADLLACDRFILPGVGAFDWAMESLENSGMRPVLEKLVLQDKRPFLGVCVGMQMLANRSDEGVLKGLAWIPGDIQKFDEAHFDRLPHLPHMGWNDLIIKPNKHPVLKNINSGDHFYFANSYHFQCQNENNELAHAEYGSKLCAIVSKENIFGVQFHPEKSGEAGLKILKNFLNWRP